MVLRFRLDHLALSFGLSLASGLAAAQNADLTEISFEDLATLKVASASKFVQSVQEAPSAVEVISREDIRRHAWRTLSEALSSLTGIYGVGDRAYGFLGARGFLVPGDYNTRFLLLIDGQRVNDNVYEQASFSEEFPLDLSLVDRIEYVPGPGSSIYGSNAIFGVINVITRRAEELPPSKFGAMLTQDGWREGRASFVQKFQSGASLLFSVTDAYKEGRDQSYDHLKGSLMVAGGGVSQDGIAHGLDRQRLRQIFTRYEDGGFSLTARYGSRQVQPSSAVYGTLFDDASLRLYDSALSLLARYQRQLSDDLGIEARVEYGESIYRGDYPFADALGNRYLNHDDTAGRRWSGDLRFLLAGFDKHKIVTGVETQVDITARQRNFDVDVTLSPSVNVDSKGQRVGVYLQDEWRLAERWRFNAGVRRDVFSSGESANSPRLGLIWLAGAETTFKLLAGQAFRVPNAYERDYGNGENYLANPALKPEKIRTVEAVWEQGFGSLGALRLSVFDYRFTNLIAQIGQGSGMLQYQNQPDIQAQGVEAAWSTSWRSGARLNASLGFNHSQDATGRRPGFSPRWIGKLRGSMPLPGEQLLVAVEGRIQGATDYLWDNTAQRLATNFTVDAVLTSARVAPGMDAYLRVLNVFDRRFNYPASDEVPVSAIPAPGRTLELGLGYAF